MAYFKRTSQLTDEEKRIVSSMGSSIILWILEGRSMGYIAHKHKLSIQQVDYNIDEMLYLLMKKVGRWRFLKILFMK